MTIGNLTKGIHMAKKSSLPHVVECSDAVEFLRQVDQLGRRGWIFRGQMTPKCRHCGEEFGRPLKSSLLRFLEQHSAFIKRSSWYPRESDSLRRFQRAAHLHLQHLPAREAHLDWLALMQHYGAPTRMLDFTFNPIVALFFALEDWAGGPAKVVVHALHADSIRQRSNEIVGGTAEERKKELNFKIGAKPPDTVSPVVVVYDGRLPSDRHLIQEGLFLVPSHIDLDFEEFFRGFSADPEPFNSHWLEFTFPSDPTALRNTVKQVMNMGTGPEQLFPGLEGLARGLKLSWLDVRKDFDIDPQS